jgi:hypothetical protein
MGGWGNRSRQHRKEKSSLTFQKCGTELEKERKRKELSDDDSLAKTFFFCTATRRNYPSHPPLDGMATPLHHTNYTNGPGGPEARQPVG